MDLVESVAVFVAGVFASTMADGVVAISPLWQAGIYVVFVSMDQRSFGDGRGDDRLDCLLLHIGEHAQDDLSAALDQAQDRRLFLFERASAARALEPPPPSLATFFWTASGFPLCPATT